VRHTADNNLINQLHPRFLVAIAVSEQRLYHSFISDSTPASDPLLGRYKIACRRGTRTVLLQLTFPLHTAIGHLVSLAGRRPVNPAKATQRPRNIPLDIHSITYIHILIESWRSCSCAHHSRLISASRLRAGYAIVVLHTTTTGASRTLGRTHNKVRGGSDGLATVYICTARHSPFRARLGKHSRALSP